MKNGRKRNPYTDDGWRCLKEVLLLHDIDKESKMKNSFGNLHFLSQHKVQVVLLV